MAAIPEKFLDLLQKKAFAQLATLMPDGSPHVAPVWCDYDGHNIIINTAKGRVKDRNMRRDPRVGIDILDPDNPYRHLSIRGRVVDMTEKGADVCETVRALYEKHVRTVEQVGGINADEFAGLNKALHRLERFWTDQILYRL